MQHDLPNFIVDHIELVLQHASQHKCIVLSRGRQRLHLIILGWPRPFPLVPAPVALLVAVARLTAEAKCRLVVPLGRHAS